MSKESNSSSGIGLTGLLFITFLVLKLTHVIDWSWWYITMPLWGGLAIVIVTLVLYVAYKLLKPEKKKSPPIAAKSRWEEKYNQMMEAQNKQKKS